MANPSHSSLSLGEYRRMYWLNLFISILTFFAHTFFYKQLDLRLLETSQEILFFLLLWNVCPAKSALIFCQSWQTADQRSKIEQFQSQSSNAKNFQQRELGTSPSSSSVDSRLHAHWLKRFDSSLATNDIWHQAAICL